MLFMNWYFIEKKVIFYPWLKVHATKTEEYLTGKALDQNTLKGTVERHIQQSESLPKFVLQLWGILSSAHKHRFAKQQI